MRCRPPHRLRSLLIALFLLLPLPMRSADFAVRAFYVDHRTEVMTIPALEGLVDKASSLGMNAIVMEWEATFPFEENATLRNAYAFTREEAKELIAYAADRGVDILPLQNCFGHCEYILRHERYAPLREDSRDFSQVCPLQREKATEVFTSIFSEIVSMHPSKYLHVGCDETRLLGHCPKCAKRVAEIGEGGLYGEYIALMCSIVDSLGKTPVVWGDIIERYPEIIPSLPRNAVIVDWNYGWKPASKAIDALLESGLEVWGASSMRCSPDNIHLTQWDVHLKNLSDYLPYCRQKGFRGIIQTSWSTSGRYGYIMDDRQVVDLQPIREVYPMSAFDLLLEAFSRACLQEKPLDREEFIAEYASEHFGLDDAAPLARLLLTPQLPVDGKRFSKGRIDSELESATLTRKMLASVSPRRCRNEWAQYILMMDIRINYLSYNSVLARVESTEQYDATALKAELKSLLKEGQGLRKRFDKAQKGYLKDTRTPLGEWSYLQGMQKLYERI